ncbi:endonuclease/exonuclease/phosphatase family protein [Microvirga brassicacearum]|uniref:EEP domain-containing protein n=1 Tax=Microvirga brassicacearum TaxID=2580413 RepID=A0A5N3P8Y6_9HYPH|nr:endonuclease/exonuclease/phosphatase family protein [Microvirga brassicacearum]KAB0266196.1 EEP domain-containing protein [Microvirga brassicacearum]
MPRILTYNVHRCLGTDGRLSPERIAEVIASCQPDVVALQELDVNRVRTGGVDQAHAIAQALGMHMHFHPALRVLEEEYGDAILTHRPARLIKAASLPGLSGRPALEPRGALWTAVNLGGAEVQLINTHLGLRRHERLAQVEALLGPEWLGHPACREPVILAGDFNAMPGSRAYGRLSSRLADAQSFPRIRRPYPTFPGRMPIFRIDHVFVSRSIEVVRAETVRTPLARKASDHLPLLVEFRAINATHARRLAPGLSAEQTETVR